MEENQNSTDTSTMLEEPKWKRFMKSRGIEKSSDWICRERTGQTFVSYSRIGKHLLPMRFKKHPRKQNHRLALNARKKTILGIIQVTPKRTALMRSGCLNNDNYLTTYLRLLARDSFSARDIITITEPSTGWFFHIYMHINIIKFFFASIQY